MTTQTITTTGTTVETGILPIVSALVIGLGILYFTGFAQAAQVHDAAHDARHTLAFPCH